MRRLLLALMLLAMSPAIQAQDAILRLRLRGPSGEVVRPSRAQLVVVAWGDTERFDLTIDRDAFVIDLGPAWLKTRWARVNDMMGMSIYVEAPGYAPTLSEPFGWPGATHTDLPAAVLVFPHNAPVPLGAGRPASSVVRMRLPAPRQLKIVDDAGTPVGGLDVSTGMFVSRRNHCGVFDGEALTSATTSAAGMVPVRDGDFPIAIALQSNEFWFTGPDKFQHVVPAGMDAVSILLHRLRRSILSQQVLAPDDSAAAGLRLIANGTFCGCGYCGITLGTSNMAGIIQVNRYSPEEWDDAWLCRGATEVWHTSTHPPNLGAGPIRLDANYRRNEKHFGDVCATSIAPARTGSHPTERVRTR